MFFNKVKNYLNREKKKGKEKAITEMINSYYQLAAKELDITTRVFDKNIIQFRRGEKVKNIWHSWTDLDGEASLMIAGDKPLCYSLLREENIPVPNYRVIKAGDYRGAKDFREKNNCAIVIKPARNTGDTAGVFVKLTKNIDIWWAVHSAGAFCNEIIVEEYFEGLDYRLLFCDGKFVAASSRVPCYIIADGKRTIRDIIKEDNKNRLPIGKYYKFGEMKRPIRYQITLNRKSINVLKDQGYSLKSIPPKMSRIDLQSTCDWIYGGEYYDVSTEISSQLVEICKNAVLKAGIKLAGVDIIAKDIKEVRNGSFIINEINTTPAIWLHYEMINQDKLRPVAVDILKAMFNIR